MLTDHWRCARTLIRPRNLPAPTVPYPYRSDLDLGESKWAEGVGYNTKSTSKSGIGAVRPPVVYPVLLDGINLVQTFSGIDLDNDLFLLFFVCFDGICHASCGHGGHLQANAWPIW